MARLLITRNRTAAVELSVRGSRRWGLLLVVGWLAQAGLRAWLSRSQVVPLSNPDESGYLIAARVLAGGPAADFSGSTLYQGGYPLLITPVFWLASSPVTVYRAVLGVNAAVSAGILPLGYLACRRMRLSRPAGYGAATVAALLSAAFFYSEYAMADAIFPVLALAWLLTAHNWLTRGRYPAAVASAVLAGYAYTVHSRGLVIVVCYAAFGLFAGVRRLVPRGTVAAAAAGVLAALGAGWALDRYLAAAIYPEGTRSLSSTVATRLGTAHGVLGVAEMAVGQLWRLVIDSWGVAGIGLAAAVAAVFWRGVRVQDRLMAALAVAVTVVTACTVPAALPTDQSTTWASGRYLDGMIVVLFLAGLAVLLRAGTGFIFGCAGCVAGFALMAAVTVAAYAGTELPTAGFGSGFNFAWPAVLTQNWTQANVFLATVVALGLLLAWIVAVLAVRRSPGFSFAGSCVAAGLSVAVLAQMTSHISQAANRSQGVADTKALSAVSGPADHVAVASNVGWQVWVPQSFEVWWTELESFSVSAGPPADATVVEMPWPAGAEPSDSWPGHPAGWRIVASNQADGWVIWRKLPGPNVNRGASRVSTVDRVTPGRALPRASVSARTSSAAQSCSASATISTSVVSCRTADRPLCRFVQRLA